MPIWVGTVRSSAAAMISNSYAGWPPRSLLASVNTSAGPTTSSIRAGGTAIIATRLTRATFAGLPPPFFGCLAGMVAEKAGLPPSNIISKYEVHIQPFQAGSRDTNGRQITEFGNSSVCDEL